VTDVFTVGGDKKKGVKGQAVNFPTAGQTINVDVNVDPAITNYLNTNSTKQGTPISTDTVTFVGSFLQPPAGSGLPPTTKNSFNYFINGQYAPISSVISFDGTTLVFDTSILQFTLISTDEVLAIGKWQ
jgi:hypothetical protein